MRFVENYGDYLDTLSVLSKPNDKEGKNGKNCGANRKSLIEDVDKAHCMCNFDAIKEEICKKYRGEPNSSCDAYCEKNGMRYLIEFKNQSEGNIKRTELRKKAFDSIALLLMNENITREELLKNVVLIVVYNNKKHVSNKSSYNPSESMDKFTKKLKGFAKPSEADQPLIKFRLGNFKGILYQDVHTLEVEDFKKHFYPILFK